MICQFLKFLEYFIVRKGIGINEDFWQVSYQHHNIIYGEMNEIKVKFINPFYPSTAPCLPRHSNIYII